MDISLHPEQVLKFKQWYDAVWLGDEEHGQTIPQTFSDERYAEYMDGYTLALGAWIESARQTANLNRFEAGLLAAHEPEREGPKFLEWASDRLVNVYGESENVDFVICLRRREYCHHRSKSESDSLKVKKEGTKQ